MREPLRYFSRWHPRATTERSGADEEWEERLVETQLKLACALMFALEVRDPTRRLVQHSARVSLLACAVAEELSFSAMEVQNLRSAAQLHEIGMMGVPPELVERPGPLTSEERERVRAHARFGAEIARITHDDAVAKLIEHQYDDFLGLTQRGKLDAREVLLTGVLRTADVFDAIRQPRPYREPLPLARCYQVLHDGAGSEFHPLAVEKLLRVESSVPLGGCG